MHAEAFRRDADRPDKGLWPALALAIGVHLAIVLLFLLGSLISWERETPASAGMPAMDASLEISASEAQAVERALEQAQDIPPLPMPQPIEEPVEGTVPPPQPVPEPRPQDAPVPQQQVPQERVPVPDTTEQDRASALAVSQERERREQEERRRQEQIDLTERERQAEAERRQRLAAQQDQERQKKLDEIRRQRAQLERDQQQARDKLRQITEARQRQAAAAPASAPAASPPAGSGGVDPNLSGEYAAAIQRAVLSQWVRPDSVPLGQRCSISIRQLPGGEVVEVTVSPSCPYDEAGRRSVEAAVLRAQPLPYRGFESVFSRNLNFNFTAQDR